MKSVSIIVFVLRVMMHGNGYYLLQNEYNTLPVEYKNLFKI